MVAHSYLLCTLALAMDLPTILYTLHNLHMHAHMHAHASQTTQNHYHNISTYNHHTVRVATCADTIILHVCTLVKKMLGW